MSQDEVAKRAGFVDRTYVTSVELGRNKASTGLIQGGYARAFGVSRDDISDYLSGQLELDALLDRSEDDVLRGAVAIFRRTARGVRKNSPTLEPDQVAFLAAQTLVMQGANTQGGGYNRVIVEPAKAAPLKVAETLPGTDILDAEIARIEAEHREAAGGKTRGKPPDPKKPKRPSR